jgi:hypothetical protein
VHRGRNYPQVLEQWISVDCFPSAFAPETAILRPAFSWPFFDAGTNVECPKFHVDKVFPSIEWRGSWSSLGGNFNIRFVQFIDTAVEGTSFYCEITDQFGGFSKGVSDTTAKRFWNWASGAALYRAAFNMHAGNFAPGLTVFCSGKPYH